MVREWSPEEVVEQLRRDPRSLTLLDVRELYEVELARIEPSTHVPMDEVPNRLDSIPRDGPIVVYCHHGARSLAVAGYLESEGFPDVGNLTGGIDAWSILVDKSIPRYT